LGSGALALDRDRRDVGDPSDELQIRHGLARGSPVVHRERAGAHALCREDRRRPAGAEPVLAGEIAKIDPAAIGLDVLHEDRFREVRGGAARADVVTDLDAVDRAVVRLGQARSPP